MIRSLFCRLGACFTALVLASAAQAAERAHAPLRKVQRAVSVPAFSFVGPMVSPVVEVPVFAYSGRMPDPLIAVAALDFTGRMPSPVVDMPGFNFVGNFGDIQIATPALQLTARPMSSTVTSGGLSLVGRRQESRSITTAPLELTARPMSTTVTTGGLNLVGRRLESRSITTERLELTARPMSTTVTTAGLNLVGRRQESRSITTAPLELTARPMSTTVTTSGLSMIGRRAGAAAVAPVDTGDVAFQVQPPRPVFRLFRVVPLGGGAISADGGTNPFDPQDVRHDVGQSLQVSAPTPITPTELPPTDLALTSTLPSFEVKGGRAAAHIQVDTAARTVSYVYNGTEQPTTPTTALSLNVNTIFLNNVTGTFDVVAPWTVVSRGYSQPFSTSTSTCTVLRYSDGVYYKLSIGLSVRPTGFVISSLSGSRHGTTQPTCP